MGESIEFPSNGSVGQGYLATAPGGGPGVVVIQEWWGLVPHIKDVCERFASAGFTALAPDLYRGKQVSEPDEAGKAAMAMEGDVALNDMSGAVDELLKHSRGKKVAVVGFCMGGGLALTLATRRPDAVSVCVPFYGIALRPDMQPDFSKMDAAVLGHYAELDEYCTPEAAPPWRTGCTAWAGRRRSTSTPAPTTRSSTTPDRRSTIPKPRPWPGIGRSRSCAPIFPERRGRSARSSR